MRKAIAKAITWRLIGTAEIFAISFWTTGQIATAGHTAGIAAITSVLMYVAHELAWGEHEAGGLVPSRGSRRPQVETDREPTGLTFVGAGTGPIAQAGLDPRSHVGRPLQASARP
jgi:uncharacterized membrane protein